MSKDLVYAPKARIMEKIIMEKEKSIMEIMATSKNYGKKSSDHFRDILNPYGEKCNYGKIGRRRRLSKLNVFFFHNLIKPVFLRARFGGSD